ncbi:hypothetical protein BOTBODRAFT_35394 [Botryobasidium botryosum FD-172 SS1]|uniref:Uncharacterized protein n=1 Tax=Botryobasidium botryosum (strain FD-172 SS1) TaxID=930990 RepID=A0A067MHH3_BOTB1|nr:hypothetical protein BOTBODRAFT_35394 [Botryobasidium botryosum FD-172 SS1]
MASPAPDVGCSPALLSTGQAIALSFITEAGFVSLCVLLTLFAHILRKFRIRFHVDIYILSLILADLLQVFGTILSMRRAIEGRVPCDAYSSVQGAMDQIGESGAVMSPRRRHGRRHRSTAMHPRRALRRRWRRRISGSQI